MNARASLLAGAPALRDWVRAGGRPERAPLAWRQRLNWHAGWSQILQAQQRQRFSGTQPLQQPVFVLGLWRSGTTLLHERLALLPGLQGPQTWQCFNPHTFLLTGAPAPNSRAVQRPMDDGQVRPDTAQEDEFALLLQGAPSLYRGFIDPRRLAALADEHFGSAPADAAAPMVTGDWQARWLYFLAGVEHQGQGRRLVLKSPNHTLRAPLLASLFPQAPRVWIGRPLEQVWHSNLRMWRSMFDTYGLWPCPPNALEDFLQRCIQRYIEVLEQALADAPGLHCWLDFDDLFEYPVETLKSLSGHGLVTAERCSDARLQAIVEQVPARAPRTQEVSLPPALQAQARVIGELHAQARVRWPWRAGWSA